MPKISFVMPTRNRSDIIKKSINSIIDQTISDWELVIVDDHSQESDRQKTNKIIKKYNDKRVKFFELSSRHGIGIAAARNFGNQMAKAIIIAVMDSDDVCFPERAEETLKTMNQKKCDLVYSDYIIVNFETGEIFDKNPLFAPREFDSEYLKKYNFVPHPTVALKKEIALNFPYNSFFEVAEDYDMMTRISSYGFKIAYINKPLIKKRRHQGNIMEKGYKVNYGKIVKSNRGWN